MKYLFNLRIFWTCRVVEGGDGLFYHRWINWPLAESHDIFAGYSKRVLNRKSSTFFTLQEKLKL